MLPRLLAQYRRYTAAGAVLLLASLALTARAPAIEGSLQGFEIGGNPYTRHLLRMAEDFGPAPALQVRFVPGPVPLEAVLEDLWDFEAALHDLHPDARLVSLHSFAPLYPLLDMAVGSGMDTALAILGRQPLSRSLVSEDGRSFLMVVQLPPGAVLNRAEADRLLAGLRSAAMLDVFSTAHVEHAVREHIRRDFAVLCVIMLATATLLLIALYHSLRALLFVASLTAASVMGAWLVLALLGLQVNVATMLVIPAVLVLSLADAVHLLTGYTQAGTCAEPPDVAQACGAVVIRERRLLATLDRYLLPSALTSVTTAAALFSLATGEAEYLRALGWAGGSAVLLALVLTHALAPVLLVTLDVPTRSSRALETLLRRLHRRAGIIGLTMLGVIPLSVLLLPRLVFDTPPEHFFPRGSTVTRAWQVLVEDFASVTGMYVLLGRDADAGSDPFGRSTELREELASLSGVTQVASLSDFRDQARVVGVPTELLLAAVQPNPFISVDGSRERLMVRTAGGVASGQAAGEIAAVLGAEPSHGDWAVTSPLLAVEYANTRVAAGMLRSFAVAAAVVSMVMGLLTRSLRTLALALVANLVPLGAAVVLFGLLRLEVSVLSSAFLVLCLGLVVDDTVHTLYRLGRTDGDLGELPYALVATTLLLSAGFAAFLASSFVPVRILGGVMAAVLLMALVADLTLIPWLYRYRATAAERV